MGGERSRSAAISTARSFVVEHSAFELCLCRRQLASCDRQRSFGAHVARPHGGARGRTRSSRIIARLRGSSDDAAATLSVSNEERIHGTPRSGAVAAPQRAAL